MATIPDKFKDLLTEKKAFGHLATLMSDGTPQVTPVWVDLQGDRVLINTAKGRIKDKNMSSNPNVAISIADPDNPYRYVQIRGRVAKRTEGASDHIDKMAMKYMGKEKYPLAAPGEVRVLYEIEPLSVQGMG